MAARRHYSTFHMIMALPYHFFPRCTAKHMRIANQMSIAITHSARKPRLARSITKVIRAINPAVIMLLLPPSLAYIAPHAGR